MSDRPDDTTRLRALVAEDDEGIRRLLAAVLELDGWEVTTARDGAEAVALARSFRPDAVLLDVMMPNMDGFSALSELRADPSTKDVAVLMVTAKTANADVVRAERAGCDEYIMKPFDPEEVVSRARARARARWFDRSQN